MTKAKSKKKKRKKLTEAEKEQIRQQAWGEIGRLQCEIINAKWYQVLYVHWCRQKIKKIKLVYKLK